MKKKIFAYAGALCLVLASGGCATGADSGDSAADAGADPWRVVLAPPTTGGLAAFGEDTVRGWTIAAELTNAEGGVDGRQV